MKSNYVFVLLACLTLACKNNGQSTPTSENSDKGTSLWFSTDDLTKVKIASIGFKDTFNLHEDQFLSIHFDLEKPLVKSLQLLAPNLSEEELLEKGNFQFSFAIDGKIIYVENLNHGAGPKALKTERLKQAIELVTPERIDWWGWYLWKRFMGLHGGLDAFTEGTHILSIAVRSYLNDGEVKVGDLLAEGEIAVEVPKIAIDESLVPIQKIASNSGWEISKDSFNINLMEALNRKIAEGRYEAINGIVVIKEGQLLIEEYFNGDSRATLHDPRSVGKTIASSVMGIAIKICCLRIFMI